MGVRRQRLPTRGQRRANAIRSAYTFLGIRIAFPLVFNGAGAMSALGHKRTFALQNGMSALPPKADIRRSDWNVR